MADQRPATRQRQPARLAGQHRRRPLRRRRGLVGRQQGVARQRVQDVGEDQLLMLLLVIQTEFDQRRGDFPHGSVGSGDQRQHGDIDVLAQGMYLTQRGTGQQAALRPGMPRTQRLVVGIEQLSEAPVERLVADSKWLQDDGFEKPAGMCKMPLCRAGVRHRLDALVFGRQWCGENQAVRAHLPVTPCERIARRGVRAESCVLEKCLRAHLAGLPSIATACAACGSRRGFKCRKPHSG